MRLIFTIFYLLISSAICAQLSIIYQYDKFNRLIKIEYPNQKKIYFYYDQDGNRIQKNVTIPTICSGTTAYFHAGSINANNTYQWQVDSGNGFANIINDVVYSGATTNTLALTNAPTNWYGYKYRCIINSPSGQSYSNEEILKFIATWKGTLNTAWENPGNWECNKVPDGNTDVTLYPGVINYPEVNTLGICRSLIVRPGFNIKVKTGADFKVTH